MEAEAVKAFVNAGRQRNAGRIPLLGNASESVSRPSLRSTPTKQPKVFNDPQQSQFLKKVKIC